MQQARRIVFIAIVALAFGLGQTMVLGQTLARTIDAELATIRSKPKGKGTGKSVVGIKIVSVDSGKVLYQHNASQPLIPASNMKLITAAAALAGLGPAFRFKTPIGMLGDDLVIIGSGDPSIGDGPLSEGKPITAIFDRAAAALTARGITRIPGKLIIDVSSFESIYRHPSWPVDQYNRWYAAPVGALNFNDNCINLTAGLDASGRGWFRIVPDSGFIQRQTRFITAPRKKTVIDARWDEDWTLSAKISLGTRPAGPVYVPIENPSAFFAELMRDRLAVANVEIVGPIVFERVAKPDGSYPDKLAVLVEHHSPELTVLIRRMNRDSQNFFAECLFKKLGFEFSRRLASYPTGSWKTGKLAVREFLRKNINVDVQRSGMVIDDGAGLSRSNRIRPDSLTAVLRYAAGTPWADAFVASLAAPGERGTLRKRMRGTIAKKRIRAKTGFIAGASALSGYVTDGKGRPRIVFSMIFNGFPRGQLWRIRQIQDRICIALVRYADKL